MGGGERSMNFSRQMGLLNPDQIKDKSIAVIGVGATGSYVASYLAQMGWGDSAHGQGGSSATWVQGEQGSFI